MPPPAADQKSCGRDGQASLKQQSSPRVQQPRNDLGCRIGPPTFLNRRLPCYAKMHLSSCRGPPPAAKSGLPSALWVCQRQLRENRNAGWSERRVPLPTGAPVAVLAVSVRAHNLQPFAHGSFFPSIRPVFIHWFYFHALHVLRFRGGAPAGTAFAR
jgi:hypothetical protein